MPPIFPIMKRARGFTLLEILLVVVLLSVSSAAVIATFPVSQKDEAKVVAQSLYQRLQLINEEAILSGKDFGLSVEENKGIFTFVSLTNDGWKKVEKRQFKAEIKVDSGLSIEFQAGSNVWSKDDRLFEPGTLFDENMFADNKKEIKPPQVFILSSGEITPFEVRIYPSNDNRDLSWRVVVEENGEIRLLKPGEQNEKA